MKNKLLLSMALFLWCVCPHAGERIPDWLAAQLPDKTVLENPGVHSLPNGRLLGVGQGVVHESLRDSQAARTALNNAEHDAKRRIARHLYPDLFTRHQSVAVDIRNVLRVLELPADAAREKAIVAIVVDAGDVSAKPVLDDSVILDAEKVFLSPDALFYLQDPLLQLGGGRVFSREKGWIAIGVGVSHLSGNDSVAEREALKRARLEAGKELSGAIFGTGFEVLEEEAETREERNGVVRMREWSSKRTKESIEGELHRAVELGYWITGDEHIAVTIAVSDHPLDHLAVRLPEAEDIPDYPNWSVEEPWKYHLLSRPSLLQGGAALVFEADAVWVLGVGAGKLSGNPANDRITAPRSAEMNARRNIVKYLNGFSTKSETREIEELVLVMTEHGIELSSVLESLRKNTRENAAGMVKNIRLVGSWNALDGKMLYQAHVVRVSTDGK